MIDTPQSFTGAVKREAEKLTVSSDIDKEIPDIPEIDESDELGLFEISSEEGQQRIHSSTRKEIPKGLWERCKQCGEAIYVKELNENLKVCPKCGFHVQMSAHERIAMLSDPDAFVELFANFRTLDPLKFEGTDSYEEKLAQNQAKTGLTEAVVTGHTKLNKRPYALGVMDFRFLGASMGSVVGEKIVCLTEYATEHRLPLVLVTASGGARMYEGMLSLMQMAKTSAALELHKKANLPYIVIMTNPTYAGVTASFASLGDLIIAEPCAMIGFAGPRVIKDTTQSKLPEGFQSAEFLLGKGLIDRIVSRKDLRKELSLLLDYFQKACILKKPEVVKSAATTKKTSTRKAAPRAKKESVTPKRTRKTKTASEAQE